MQLAALKLVVFNQSRCGAPSFLFMIPLCLSASSRLLANRLMTECSLHHPPGANAVCLRLRRRSWLRLQSSSPALISEISCYSSSQWQPLAKGLLTTKLWAHLSRTQLPGQGKMDPPPPPPPVSAPYCLCDLFFFFFSLKPSFWCEAAGRLSDLLSPL